MISLRFFLSLVFSICCTDVVYALNLSSPSLHEVLLPVPNTLADKILGARLSVSGATAAVSALTDNTRASGSVYIYDAEESWRLTTELNSPLSTDNFGQAIVLENNTLIVSADRDGEDAGAVYVFERNSLSSPEPWQQTAKISPPDGIAGDRFGGAIALAGDTLYIGAPLHTQGKLYIFKRNPESRQWLYIDSVIPDDPQALKFASAIATEVSQLLSS
ncbi:hypothetical protein bplSymb_SCF00608P026 [Bathymodiolus platifrons methanotrophic gill symbiont]|uniref:FG-GAP repeat protein n=1 Tax=Bathymodiolus platifrons methanotrophic gill symbiont TaxID=113268 RepID=UPI000B40EE12|nr:FG-GAP repeat protein [Bathymodiolus platifrons methanotrophic gill symbiont]GAW85406.1 hypothetical protein bplSymb_SCF00608P026 [Bathymodiolus platifrons methanotrophic gill symbiont]GFO75609.1 hypothetical protein BPLS_P2928 [Bathymodiolus platifrons methanotrophic gill symbiont]